jgi:hypothetical protein
MTPEAELLELLKADEHLRRVLEELEKRGGATTDEVEAVHEQLQCIASDVRELKRRRKGAR